METLRPFAHNGECFFRLLLIVRRTVAEGDPGRIRQVRTGAVALFRGRLWPDADSTGLLHRSPAVPKDIGARLLLVVDPVV
ncbi:DUF1826 domain-containing protein [Labrenzia sp. VG12]|uniref:DUF1826 domain-containing protein n=1 Tax=Labrenzia sp. VG12 TaxID=2021862 RepID=UPI001AD8DBA1|nr:DUF1826 domain-containing protein [Labrenzia sp. VG12]